MKARWVLAALAVAVLAGPAEAKVPFYLGVSGSMTTAGNFSANEFNEDVSFDASRTSEKKTTTGYKVTAGLQLAPYMSLEGGYIDLGKPTFSTVSNGPPPCCIAAYYATGPVSGSIAGHGTDLALVLQWPLRNDISVGARGGLLYWDLQPEVRDSNGEKPVQRQSGNDRFYGVNVRIGLVDNLDLSLDYDLYKLSTSGMQPPARLNHYEVNGLSVGVLMRFGTH